MRKPLIFLSLIALAVIAAVLVADPDPDKLRSLRDGLVDWRDAHPLALPIGFFVTYVVVTALSLPFAVWLTLLGAALLGFWQGLVLISFASSFGALLAFLVARYLMRDWVRGRLGPRLAKIEKGAARDGEFYLFSLRLIPVVPFFVINLAFGLTRMKAWKFYGVSQLGMLPGTAVYVAAGAQLGELDSLSGIVSPGLLGAFAALAVFPWVARAALRIWTRRRAYRVYKRPAKFDRNLIVIGAGAAGLVASYVAAQAKAKVTLVQEGPMGGDCLNFGCVPSKALIASARAAGVARRSADLGVKAEVSVDWPVVMRRISEVIAQIAPNDSVERYQGLGVEVIEGHARLEDPWTVRVGERRLTARGIVLATGAAPVIPPIEGIETVEPLTSDTLWDALAAMAAPPGKMVILGGGPIGCEIAQALARLGAGVTLIEAAERLLIREDAEAAETIEAALRADGIEVMTGAKAIRFGRDAGKWLELEDGSKLQFDTLLVAVGRKARLEGFGLEDLGIPADRVIETNDYLETLMPNIYAAGDVAGPMQLTNAAGHQGWIAAANALASPFWRFKAHAAPIPHAVFTAPELARVGMTAAQAEAEGVAHEVTTYPLGDLDRALAEGAGEGFVRIVTAKGSDKILGVTICGAHAAEVLAEFVLAMRHGLGLGKILATPHVYPSWSEAAKNAAGRWRQAHVNPSTLKIAERFMSWRRG
ncbi:pyridine nucleotide-disulfide oxidoreductase [Thioclava marina]|uniref:Pyridine nucleotide-disulfide oxidoreductase n=1 Tax=Thioclava marina TaxID=1915077 RepID=A0ABX3MRA9_9RHOB|nr:bifunctional TVP38/TMEM64 family protein/FAD-dependent oxidoreductase [Thioclava marina]OOY13922.1 pyridine nucleotide-disulfide oxidoreductase [Thioclava marina]